MAVWDYASARRLSIPHRSVVAVNLDTPDGASHPLAALSDGALTVTFDETAAPYVTASASVAPTDTVFQYADPLKVRHLSITAGYEWDDGTRDVGTLARLPLLTRDTTRPEDRVKLTATSVETYAMRHHFMQPPVTISPDWGPVPDTARGTLAALYGYLARRPTARMTAVGGAPVLAFPAAWNVVEPDYTTVSGYFINVGDNLWDVMQGFGDALGHRVYGDELGRWAGRTPGNQDKTVAHMRIAPGDNLLSSEATFAYGEHYNSVIDVYDVERNGERVKLYGRALLAGGDYSAFTSPERVKVTNRDARYISQEAATAAAERRVRNLAARRTLITVEAVADYRVRPKFRITLRLPSWSADEAWIVQAVTFTPGTGRMKLTLRRPIDDTATVNPTGE